MLAAAICAVALGGCSAATTPAAAETITAEHAKVTKRSVTFKVKRVKPRQIVSGRVRSGERSVRVKPSVLRSGLKRGRLAVSRRALRPLSAGALRRSRLVIVVDVLRPQAPASVTVATTKRGQRIRWTRGSDDRKLRGYRIYRAGRRLGQTRRRSFTDRRGRASSRYTVRAYDGSANVSVPTKATRGRSAARQRWTCGWGRFSASSLPSRCWRPFGDGSFINTPLPANPRLVPNSSAMVSRILSFGDLAQIFVNARPQQDYYHPYFFSKPSDPVYTVNSSRPGGPDGIQVRIPAAAKPAAAEDSHLAVYDQQTGYEYSFYGFPKFRPASGGTISAQLVQRARVDGNGGGDGEILGFSNASGTGLMGGIIRLPEIEAGRIDHALFLVAAGTNGGSVYPARSYGTPCGRPDCPPTGQWLRLDMTSGEIDDLPVAGWQKTIFKALATYGGFVGDQGAGNNAALALHVEGPSTWTSYGLANPWEAWAERQQSFANSAVGSYRDASGKLRYELDVFDAPIDWRSKLKAVDPCVISRTC
ncbi:MAG: hypothetical protein M3376_10020 [Actinomycetota bacterium]|nr:hypothetical protein [Actinomycetota bacterium]